MSQRISSNQQIINNLAHRLAVLLCLVVFIFSLPRLASTLLLNWGTVSCLKSLVPYNAFDHALLGQFSSTVCRDDWPKFEMAKRLNADSGQAMFWMGYINWVQGNLAGALNTFDVSGDMAHTDISRLIAGVVYEQAGQIGLAEGMLRQTNAPARAMTMLGDRLASQNACARAETFYRMAIRQSGSAIWQPHVGLAECLFKSDRLEEAVSEYRFALQLGLKDAVIANQLGKVLVSLKRPAEAIPWLARAFEWHSYPIYLTDLAKAYEVGGDVVSAGNLFLDATHQFPNSSGTFWELGNFFQRYQRFQESVKAYQKALLLDPQCPYYCYSDLGRAYISLGCPSEAYDAFMIALERNPGNPTLIGWIENAQNLKLGSPGRCQ